MTGLLQNYKKILSIAVVILVTPFLSWAQTPGIIPERVWLSHDPVYVGDSVEISTVVSNVAADDFVGTIEFLDGATVLGKSTFFIPSGESEIVSLQIVATEGSHSFSARIVEAVLGHSSIKLISTASTGKVVRSIHKSPTTKTQATSGTSQQKNIARVEDGAKKLVSSVKIPEVLGASTTITNVLPYSIAPKVAGIIDTLESVREGQGNDAKILLERAASSTYVSSGASKDPKSVKLYATSTLHDYIGQGWTQFKNSVDNGALLHSPWQYVQLFCVLTYGVITQTAWLFYATVILLAIGLVRIVSSIIWG